MSAARDLIQRAASAGIRLEARGDRLRVEAPRGTMTPALHHLLSSHKAELLAELAGTRAALHHVAAAEGVNPALVHALHADDLAACAGLSADALRAYVLMLHESAQRARGARLPSETAAVTCLHCGPVWAAPEVAAVAPIVRGAPLLLGCPWCFNRRAGRPIPRPAPTTPPAPTDTGTPTP